MGTLQLRWANIKTNEENGVIYSVRVLQVMNSETGEWEDVPVMDGVIERDPE